LERPGQGGFVAKETSGLHSVILYSLFAGVCPLIPVPWVDDFVLARVRRAAFRRLFRQGGAEPSSVQLAELTADRSSWLRGCFAGLVLYPLKRIFRKIIFVFTLKDCVDAASRTFHQLWLVRHLTVVWQAGPAEVAGGVAAFARLKRALDQTLAETDPRPVEQVFKIAFRQGRRRALDAAAALGRAIRRARGREAREAAVDQLVAAAEARAEAGAEAFSGEGGPGEDTGMQALVEQAESQLLVQRGYFEALERRFLRHLQESPDPLDVRPAGAD
jgi:hypothetical protein